ncbi:helix-turn-helix transcriptional regulator [Photobacterium leiognathi]|uniref:helix-turn-helix transcriptional regulator n=1 Tax=Photobacterium leiognathi TaxID=553611 RepID=UPI00298238FD|nr:hypothetical protein [Photobacterium leiognathi]
MSKPLNLRRPTTPGEMIWEELMLPRKTTLLALSKEIDACPFMLENMIMKGERLTPTIIAKLSTYFSLSPEFFLNLQYKCDLFEIQQQHASLSNDNNKS